MSNYGLTLTGYVTPTVDQIRNDFNTLMRAKFGQSLDLGDSDPVGFAIGIFSAALVSAYQANQVAWSAIDPDAATGVGLDSVSLLTGTFRVAASSSQVLVSFTGADATPISSGFVVSTSSTGIKFATKAPAITTLNASWAATTLYTTGQRVTNGGKSYVAKVGGTSAGAGGPTQTTGTQVDGTVTWLWIGTGVATVDVWTYSQLTGPLVAIAGDVTAIATPTAGINTAYNQADATLGTNLQTDQGLRLFRAGELALDGNATFNALRAALLNQTNVPGSTGVNLFNNVTDATDANGVPPHSIIALVTGGADQDIYNTLFNSVPVGIRTAGSQTGTVVDGQGVSQSVSFSRPVNVPIYVRMSLTKLVNTYAGDVNMQTIVAAAGNARAVGADAIASALAAAAFAGDSSVIDVPQTLIYTDVIGTPVAWVATTAYVATAGLRSVVIADGGRCYICTVGGISGSTGPSGIGSAITDGAVTWAFLGNTIAIDAFHDATYSTANTTIISTNGTL